MRKRSMWVAFIATLVLLISACAPALPVATPELAIQEPAKADAPDQPTLEAAPTEGLAQGVGPTLVPVKSALEASDPASISLASGGPLLVEFFAFW